MITNIADYEKLAPQFSSGKFILPKTKEEAEIYHAIIGISTEAGEALDAVKKAMIYGRELNLVNLDEEIGDLLWYITLYAKQRNLGLDYFAALNFAKLSLRYPDKKFEEEKEKNRNLGAELDLLQASFNNSSY